MTQRNPETVNPWLARHFARVYWRRQFVQTLACGLLGAAVFWLACVIL